MFVKKNPSTEFRIKNIFKLLLALVFGGVVVGFLFSKNFIVFAQTPPAAGDNKFGLNVAARVDHIDKGAGRYVNSTQKNGWIVMMPNAANSYNNFEATRDEIIGSYFSQLGSDFKYVLRAHFYQANSFPSQSDPSWASKWADFWARIVRDLPIPAGAELYFIPWNEPNLDRECDGLGAMGTNIDCVPYVKKYIAALNSAFAKYGVRGKIKFLSPAMAISAPNYQSFVNALGGKSFFDGFDGVAMDYYDFETGCGAPFCNPNPLLNPSKFEEVLSSLVSDPNTHKMYMVETGLVSPNECGPGVPDCPNFIQPDITKMICELNKKHGNNPRLAMFSPLTYDPEPKENGQNQGDWFFDTEETRNFYESRTTDCANITGSRSSKITDLFGRDPYNRIMAMGNSRYFPWNYPYSPAISSDQYNKNTFPLGSDDYKLCLRAGARSGELSCPDYSPNRPFPGDSSLDSLDTHNEDETDLAKYQMKDFSIGGIVSIPLCNKLTGACLTDIPTQSTAGKNAAYFKDAFVDFLGMNNEYTSSPNYIMSLKNNISRTALFLTDFLGGMADIPGVAGRSHEIKDYIDAYQKYQADIAAAGNNQALINLANAEYQAKISAIPNLKENLQLTSGLLGKAITSNAKIQAEKQEQTLVERWALNNIPHDLNAGKYASNTDPSLMPVGDYVVAYKCAEGDGVLSNEEDFPDSLERRDAVSARTKAKCGDKQIIPVRISDYVCSASQTQIWNSIKDKFKYTDPKTGQTKSFDKKDICRGKEDPSNDILKKWSEADLLTLKKYFVTGRTHEDVPVRVVLQCPTNYTSPGVEGQEIAPGVAFFPNELDEGEMRQKGVDRYAFGGQYDATNKVYNFTTVTRTYIYIGHLAEAREQTFNTDNLLFPASFQEEQKSAMSLSSQAQINAIDFSKEKLSTFNTDVAKSITAKPSAKGDLIAEDSKNRLDPLGDASQLTDYQIAKKPELTQRDQERIDEWLLKDPLTRGGGPVKDVALTANCKINVEIPYIQETAARTIGEQHGFYRLFFSKAEQKIIDEKIAAADTKGAGVASSQYLNISAGSGQTTTDQKFFIPWVDAMKTWNSALNFGVNPLGAQKAAATGISTKPPGGDTVTGPYQACLIAGVDFHDVSVDRAKTDQMFNVMKSNPRYKNSWLLKSEGKDLWDNLIDTAISGNLNPYLALAYWAEETGFTMPKSDGGNGNPADALGCGKFADGTSCIQTGLSPQEAFSAEFRCFAAKNPSQTSCNNQCISQSSTLNFIGCYQRGAGNPPGDTHLTNLINFYHQLKGDAEPTCTK